MKRLCLIVLCICLPLLAFGQDFSTYNLLNPPAIANGTDLSVGYLGDIFGIVDGVLHGGGSQVMGKMFMVFNAGALILGGIIILYTTMLGLMNTANEGEVLGKKWNSVWIPLRTVLGITLLVPKATGYCAIQIFMMWVIVQGVSLADTVWNSVTGYLSSGGVIVQQALAPNQNVSKSATEAFRMDICLAALQTGFSQQYQAAVQEKQNPPIVPDFTATINPLTLTASAKDLTTVDPTCSSNTCYAPVPYFAPPSSTANGVANWSGLNGACGVISWPAQNNTPYATLYQTSMQTAVQQILLDLMGPAQQWVDQYYYPPAGVQPNSSTNFLSDRMFLNAAEDYQGIMFPVQHLIASSLAVKETRSWLSGANKAGWIEAGSYYAAMTNTSMNVSATFTGPTTPSKAELNTSMSSTLVNANIPSPYTNQFTALQKDTPLNAKYIT